MEPDLLLHFGAIFDSCEPWSQGLGGENSWRLGTTVDAVGWKELVGFFDFASGVATLGCDSCLLSLLVIIELTVTKLGVEPALSLDFFCLLHLANLTFFSVLRALCLTLLSEGNSSRGKCLNRNSGLRLFGG